MSSGASRLVRVTAVYAFCHFVVDLACVTCVLGLVAPVLDPMGSEAHFMAVLVYDMVAFCMQLPAGALLDVMGPRRWKATALLSFALVAVGVVISRAGVGAMVAIMLVALGNAAFHCAGGEEVLLESGERAAPSGLFISTGAAGVFLGGLSSFQQWALAAPALLALLGVSAVLAWHLDVGDDSEEDPDWTLDEAGRLAVVLLAVTVALRSYAGMVMAFPWKAELALAAVAIAAVVAGKAAGGIVADRFGMRTASVVSLGGAAPLFLLAWGSVPAGLVATLLFNFTMAITLSELARLLPRARGTAFGIASFSLAIGAFPALLGLRASSPEALCALSLVSLASLLGGLAVAEGTGRR